MEPDMKYPDSPPSYEDTLQTDSKRLNLPPATLVLEDKSIRDESEPSTHLYQLSRTVTTLPRTPPKNSSVIFERLEHAPNVLVKPETSKSIPEPRCRHLFYLAHPADAQYRTDIPGYYMTSVDAAETVGNIHLETSKSRLQKTEFTALLSVKRTASHKPLFDEGGKLVTLFKARATGLMNSRYIWTDGSGHQVAFEVKEDEKYKLAITTPMSQASRDALVGLWVLKLWYETAESKDAKRDALERMMPLTLHQDMRLARKTGALGALGALGGAGC
ncbi:hypothetical protein BJX99DRAFT_64297 [Aspergillus californicus]